VSTPSATTLPPSSRHSVAIAATSRRFLGCLSISRTSDMSSLTISGSSDARRSGCFIEAGALGDLEDHAVRDLAERRVRGEQLLVVELEAVHVDEQQRIRRRLDRST